MPLTMKLDDREFTLSDDCLKAMAATLWHTKVKERGFSLCQDREISPGSEHIGGMSSISQRNCRGKPKVGYYHTHPNDTSSPSWWDAFSIISESHKLGSPVLGCRGGWLDETICCETAGTIPSLAEVAYLRSKRRKMKFTRAEDDPEISKYLTSPHSFFARRVPEIIKPPVPVPAPKIKAEELVFANSMFIKYIDIDTGQVLRIEKVY